METFEPIVAHTRQELAEAMDSMGGTVGLVMTMGALHSGHLQLVREARQRADVVVTTIFVNPLQFGAGEDLDRYPRTLEADVKLLAEAGVDIVYAPSEEVVYPYGRPQVSIDPGPMGTVLEGETRPGHFAGVLQIVAKMFNLIDPDFAVFGQKDTQQLALVRQMVRDLDFNVEIVAVPVQRDLDGLAISSRNAYLSDEEREAALALSAALSLGMRTAAAVGSAKAVLAATREYLEAAPGIRIDYVALVDPMTMIDAVDAGATTAALLVAAWVGKTRLIDSQLVVLARP